MPDAVGSDLSQNSAPPKNILRDNHGRTITYLRLGITDRCNLRCRYCRPEKGVPFVPHAEILRLEELLRLTTIFADLGISKVRVTGGEPFARRGCVDLLRQLSRLSGVESVHLTTNGVACAEHIAEMEEMGIAGVNLSLDTRDRKRFWAITRRDQFPAVENTLKLLLHSSIAVKINAVVLDDTTDAELLFLAELARNNPISVRFIEKMPFSGTAATAERPSSSLLERFDSLWPEREEIPSQQPATARLFRIAGFTGQLGFIAGNSRTFCGTCNKVRVTPSGMLKTCLYDNGVLDLKKMLRSGANDQQISAAILHQVGNRHANGRLAEEMTRLRRSPSMSMIGG